MSPVRATIRFLIIVIRMIQNNVFILIKMCKLFEHTPRP